MHPESEQPTAATLETPQRERATPVTTEIDAKEVLDAFRQDERLQSGLTDVSGYDRNIRRIPPEESQPVVTKACPVCGCESAEPTFAIEGLRFQVVTCLDCGLGKLHPQPAPDEIAGFYPDSYYGSPGAKFEPVVEMLVRLIGGRHARWLTRGLTAGARVLDVGCGRGHVLKTLADNGFETHGFEITATAAQGTDPRTQIRIGSQLADVEYPDDYFDQVIMWHVLEHLPNPRETLQEIRRVLKPGGRLVAAVPNFSSLQARWTGPAWFHLDLPRHLFHFPVSALRRLVEDCGFTCRSEHHFSLRQNPFGWVQSLLNRDGNLPRNGLYRLLHRRSKHETGDIGRCTRLRLRATYLLGMLPALCMSLLAAAVRSGGSVHVLAELPKASTGAETAESPAESQRELEPAGTLAT